MIICIISMDISNTCSSIRINDKIIDGYNIPNRIKKMIHYFLEERITVIDNLMQIDYNCGLVWT